MSKTKQALKNSTTAPVKSASFGQGKPDAARFDNAHTRGWTPRQTWGGSLVESDARLIRSRARDLDQNNGWINAGLDRRVESVIGGQIKLSAQPVASLLGRDINWRMNWARDVQARFRVWSNDIERRCDAGQRWTFGAMAKLAYLNYVRDGNACAEIRDSHRGLRNPTNVLLVAHERIGTPPLFAGQEGPTLRNGIRMDANSAPIGYYVRNCHPDDPSPTLDRESFSYIPARGPTGRAKFIHVFSPRRVEQQNGISRLAEAMIPAKMIDRVDTAELETALQAALFSMFVKSPGTTNDVAEAFAPGSVENSGDAWIDRYLGIREDSPIMVRGAQVTHLLPGEDVEFPDRNSPNSNYADFVRLFLQKISGSLGVSYQQLSQDWASINYSSARALLNEMWRSFLEDRHFFTQQFLTPIYAAWLEWEVANGDVKVPGGPSNFYRNKTAICMAEWIGPGRGSVDPNKEADGANKDTAAGRTSTIEHILERGRDPDDVLAEEAYYQKARESHGLNPPQHDIKASAEGSESAGGGTEDDRDGDGVPNEDQRNKKKKGAAA